MRNAIYYLIFCASFASCLFYACMPQTKSAVEHADVIISFSDSTYALVQSAFAGRNVEGCFILYDADKDTSLLYNEYRCTQEFLPASTFKIANSMIALNCKVVKDINEVISWDGVERVVPAWNQDQTMRTAFRYSTVWFYQELARRTGKDKMREWVEKLDYGNKIIAENIDDFWLVGDLRITPWQQLDFLRRFVDGKLPVKKKIQQQVMEIMVEEQTERYTLRAKTGWADVDQPVGWYVGWLQYGSKNYFFVLNMDIVDPGDQIYRKEITKEILNEVFQIDLSI